MKRIYEEKENTELKNDILTAGLDAQYDQTVKQLVSHKIILAHILVGTVDEFQGMDPQEVAKCIEGEVRVGTAYVDPGLTNQEGKIRGANTEDAPINEGMIRFDILFYVRTPDGLSQIIINIELQKDAPRGYDILNRAVFYACRSISSQKTRDFEKNNYNDIKRVFSAWICMGMEECYMNHICLADTPLIGHYSWKGRLDLLNIVMVGLPDKAPEQTEPYKLHRLLSVLLSKTLQPSERIAIVQDEYSIEMEREMRKELVEMCNLSQGIREDAQKEGMEQGLKQGLEQGMEQGLKRGLEEGRVQSRVYILHKMHNKGYSYAQIADILDMTSEEVQSALENA